jgi:hypothetical protein
VVAIGGGSPVDLLDLQRLHEALGFGVVPSGGLLVALMVTPFEASRIKIDRATRHLQELRDDVSNFFQRGAVFVAFEIAPEYSAATGSEMGAFVYREGEPIPRHWAAIIGDVIHNARASLDLLASDVHRITGGDAKDTPHVHYPFCKERSGLGDMIKSRRLQHAGREFLEIVEQTAPYKGGNDGLRAIHDLDLLDKHQALVPTVATVAIDWPVKIVKGSQ